MNNEAQVLALDTIRKFLQLYRYMRFHGRKVQAAGLRGREFAVLRYLNNGPLKIGELSNVMFISASSTSEMVSRMEDAGYVTRKRCKSDNRVVYVELTQAGRELAENTPMGGIPLLREKMHTLPEERLLLVNKALAELIQLLEMEPEKA
ncbi:MAG: MarR family transcriptional regulator [Anaerolineae bacterium]|nr:MarR family transcriptional regulator [Anaerolineae bacterium]